MMDELEHVGCGNWGSAGLEYIELNTWHKIVKSQPLAEQQFIVSCIMLLLQVYVIDKTVRKKTVTILKIYEKGHWEM